MARIGLALSESQSQILDVQQTSRLRASRSENDPRLESFVRTRYSAGFTTITSGFEFSVHTTSSVGPLEADVLSDRASHMLPAPNASGLRYSAL